jgi:chloramphenicol 3-O phosphotransferase
MASTKRGVGSPRRQRAGPGGGNQRSGPLFEISVDARVTRVGNLRPPLRREVDEDNRRSTPRAEPTRTSLRSVLGQPYQSGGRDDARMEVIMLNGTSSAGKSTLASALQSRLSEAGECWIVIGIDDFLGRLPWAWVTYGDHVGEHADEGIAFEVVDGEVECRVGPLGERMLAAYRAAVAAIARAGINVIVDEVLLSDDGWNAWQVQLDRLKVTWVAVTSDLDVAEQRERDRTDRMIGLARSQHGVVHRRAAYDVQVDTGTTDPAAAAAAILAAR